MADRSIFFLSPEWATYFALVQNVWTGYQARLASCSVIIGVPSSRVKRLGRGTDHLTLQRIKMRMSGAILSLPRVRLCRIQGLLILIYKPSSVFSS